MMNRESIVDKTHYILDTKETPTGEENWFDLTKRYNIIVGNVSHQQGVYIGQEVTKEVFGRGNGRYALPSMQTSHDKMLSDTSYRWRVDDGNFAHNRELILQSGFVIPDPKVRIIDKEFEYVLNGHVINGRKKIEGVGSVPVEIDFDNAVETLIRAGFMKRPNELYRHEDIDFHRGLASAFSYWDRVSETPKYSEEISLSRKEIRLFIGLRRSHRFPHIGKITYPSIKVGDKDKHYLCFTGGAYNPFKRYNCSRLIFERIPPIENKLKIKNKPKNKAIISSNNGLKRTSTIESEIKKAESNIREVEKEVRETILNCC
jgi:hypothetical protein